MKQARGTLVDREISRMNKTEVAYSGHLKARGFAGEIAWAAFEPMNLRLAKGATYKPDFLVMLSTGFLEFHEVKGGFWREAAHGYVSRLRPSSSRCSRS